MIEGTALIRKDWVMLARKILGILMTVLLGLLIGAPTAMADREDARQREAVNRARVKPNDAAEIARREFPGAQVRDVDVETIRGTVTYAVEVETEGRIRTVLVDLDSGDVMRVPSDRDEDDDDDDDDDDGDDDDGRRRPRR
jgi:uncharacterized membrane protein YkoI